MTASRRPGAGTGSLRRAAIYSVTGFVAEIAFSALHDGLRRRPVSLRTSPLMLPIYALVQPLYEPLHDRLRRAGVPAPGRAAAYGLGFLGVEYASGAFLRAVRGDAPWDYSYARVHVGGLIRPDYLPLWAVAGLLLEPLHDRLAGDGRPPEERASRRSGPVPDLGATVPFRWVRRRVGRAHRGLGKGAGSVPRLSSSGSGTDSVTS